MTQNTGQFEALTPEIDSGDRFNTLGFVAIGGEVGPAIRGGISTFEENGRATFGINDLVVESLDSVVTIADYVLRDVYDTHEKIDGANETTPNSARVLMSILQHAKTDLKRGLVAKISNPEAQKFTHLFNLLQATPHNREIFELVARRDDSRERPTAPYNQDNLKINTDLISRFHFKQLKSAKNFNSNIDASNEQSRMFFLKDIQEVNRREVMRALGFEASQYMSSLLADGENAR